MSEEQSIETGGGSDNSILNVCYFVSKQLAWEFSDILRLAIRQAKATTSQQAGFIDELEKLEKLHRSGALTDTEFQNAKRKLGI